MKNGTVLDQSNIVEFLTTGEATQPAGLTSRNQPAEAKEPKQVTQEEGKTAVEAKAAPESKVQETASPEAEDDVEGEDGLTPRQKRELTDKMRKAIGAKHRALKEAEEFAGDQYRERRLAEQRAERAERELARTQAQSQPQTTQETDKPPARENFKSDQEYQDAVIDYRVDVKLKAKAAQDAQAQQASQQDAIRAQASARIAAAIEAVPDFTEVTEAADIEVPPYIAGYMQESELFAELGYHFAKNPEILERLAKLSPAKALVEVGKLETTLKPFSKTQAAQGEKPAAARSRAPAPITPVDSSGRQVKKDEREMDTREAIDEWQAKRKVNLYARQRH